MLPAILSAFGGLAGSGTSGGGTSGGSNGGSGGGGFFGGSASATSGSSANNLFDQVFGGMGDLNVTFGNSKMTATHEESQSPIMTASQQPATGNGAGGGANPATGNAAIPAWVMPVAIGGVAVLAIGIIVLAVKK